MELRQLKYFLAVADARSFVGAAGQLYISRQAVSKAVAQLETELGVELFMRDSGGAFLTPAGVTFYERVRSNVLELEQLQQEMQQYGTRFHQSIRLVFSVGTLYRYETALQEYLQRQKNVVIEYRECTPDLCQELLLERKADLAVTSQPVTSPLLHSRLLETSPYGVLLRSDEALAELEAVELQDLQWLPVACFADVQTQQLCSGSGLSVRYTGIDLMRLVNLAADGRCAVLLPQSLVPKTAGGCRWLPVSPSCQWNNWLACRVSLEKNTLFHSALDELSLQVFGRESGL